jgi:kynurenine 3-monooxygenase
VEKLAQKQGKILLGGMAGIVALMIPAMGYASWALWRWNRASHASRASVMGIAKIGDITERIGRVFT